MSYESFAIIGGGKMGEAILSGWLASTTEPSAKLTKSHFTVVEPSAERRDYLTETYGVSCLADVSDIQGADVILLAVKPQVMMDVLQVLTQALSQATAQSAASEAAQTPNSPLFISIAAGLTTARLEEALPNEAALVRVMPNMPLMIGQGASAVCAGTYAGQEQVQYVTDLFGCLGRAVMVDEADMDAVCALSGSGPAYVAALVEVLRDAAAAHGLDAQLAETLALQTVTGTAQLILDTDLSPEQAREAVCSPGGTTLAALDAMNEAGFNQVIDAGIDAAVHRSKELAQCS